LLRPRMVTIWFHHGAGLGRPSGHGRNVLGEPLARSHPAPLMVRFNNSGVRSPRRIVSTTERKVNGDPSQIAVCVAGALGAAGDGCRADYRRGTNEKRQSHDCSGRFIDRCGGTRRAAANIYGRAQSTVGRIGAVDGGNRISRAANDWRRRVPFVCKQLHALLGRFATRCATHP
jgi:hypothetical protein